MMDAGGRVDVVVIGAGLAGLAAAHELRRAGLSVRVLDAGERPGGVVRSERVDGYLVEHGPNTLRIAGTARPALQALGIEPLLVPAAPANRLRFLYREGALVPFPLGPLDALRTPLVSARGKLRIASEPFRRRGDGAQETVAEFIGRRLGREAVEHLVAPFLTGVYAGDETQLGAEAVFPSLVEAERDRGSIVAGMLRPKGKAAEALPALPGIHSCEAGLGAIPAHLAAGLGETLAVGTEVMALARDGEWIRVEAGHAGTLEARQLVLATPASATARLAAPVSSEAAETLEGIGHAPLVVMHLGVELGTTAHPIEGFGFLVPREARLGLLGCLFLSNLFPGRAPEGKALLTCMVGGVRWPEAVDEPEDRLRERLAAELERTLGLRGAPHWLRTLRWKRAVPQPGVGHRARVADVQARLAPAGIEVAGSWVAGVSFADTLASGVAAARRVLERR